MGEKLLEKINNENALIIHEIIDIILDEKINDLNELKHYQEKNFVIDGKLLSTEEQIDRAKKMLNTIHNYDDISFDDNQKLYLLEDELENSTTDEDRIINITKLEAIYKKPIMFPYDAYLLIIDDKL